MSLSFILFSLLFLTAIPSQESSAFDDGHFWNLAGGYPIDRGFAGSIKFNNFEIHDPNLDDNGNSYDQIAVKVESKDASDQIIDTLDLLLTEKNDDGLFGIEHLVFMLEEAEFDITDMAIITIEDPDGNSDENKAETLFAVDNESVIVYSDTDPSGIAVDLKETGLNTSIFSATISFSTTESNEDNLILHVSQGDRITVQYQPNGAITNGLILGDPERFAILVEIGGFVYATATPNGSDTPITDEREILDSPGGSGTGGFPRAGLVVDSSSNSPGGSSCPNCEPPTLGVDKNNFRLVENGFSYNGNPIDANLYYTPYPLVSVTVGEENKAVLKVYDNEGPQNIEHVGIGFGLRHGESFSESKATINVDRTLDGKNLISTYDPENVFQNIRVDSEIVNCGVLIETQCMIFTIYHTFREPLNFDMIGTYIWDFDNNPWQNYFNHGIHIFGDSLNPPKTKSVAFGSNEMRGLYTLTQINKFEDKWVDEFGNIYQHKGNDRFDKISSIPNEKVFDSMTMHGCDRLCNWFEDYKKNQEILAKEKLDAVLMGKEITNVQKGFVAPSPYTKIPRSEDTFLQNRIMEEINRATEIFEYSFEVKNNF